MNPFIKIGAPGGIRTPDPQVRSLVLYPAELRAQRKMVPPMGIEPMFPPYQGGVLPLDYGGKN